MRIKEGIQVVGRRTLIGTVVAAVYFGVELAAYRARGVQDGANTGLAGAIVGGYLGSLGEQGGGVRVTQLSV
jgi:hypothetical protein